MAPGTSNSTDRKLDCWADWLIRGRDRGTTAMQRARTQRFLAGIRDRVLRGAQLRPGERVVDLGAGTGLLALEARKRVKGAGYVLAVDISSDALSECQRQAKSVEGAAPLACIAGDELISGVPMRKLKRADIEAGIRRRPSPNMPSYEEVARTVLGDRADAYLERYVRFRLKSGGARSATAYVYLVATR